MKITVINGTEKKGVTHRLKALFLEEFAGRADVTEFFLPKDCPAFCAGCTNCFLQGEKTCKDAEQVQKIEAALLEADLLVFTSPVYAFHTTAAMKNLLDHLAYRWIVHRPAAAMFGKRAVILTQCLGAGGKSAAKDIKDSLSWWGVSHISVLQMPLMEDAFWDKLSEQRKQLLTGKVKKLAGRLARVNFETSCKPSLLTKGKFMACRMMQKSVLKDHPDSFDAAYWKGQGWLDGERPW